MKKTFKFLTVFLLALLGASVQPAWAWDWKNSPRIYFDNSVTNYSNVTIILGNDGHSDCTQLSKIDNTKLYTGTPNYSGMNDGYFLDCSGWGSEDNKPYNRRSSASHYTGNNYIQKDYDGNGTSKNYVFVPKSSNNGCELDQFQVTFSGSTPTTLNKTITIKAKVDGTATNAPGKLTASSYKFSAYATCGTSSSATLDAGSSSTTCTVGYTANTTLTALDVVGYTFDGWYNGSTKISSNKSCTVNPIGGETYFAAYTAITYYLKKSNGSSEGTKVGTFTKTGTGTYTCTWTSNTSNKAYFYVSLSENSATDNANFLGSKELTDGTSQEVWLYGTSSDKWGDAQYITSPYDGVDYVFTFTIGEKYYIKCDYPDLYTGLSVTKNPAAGSANNPTISKNYVTQGQSVNVEAKTAATGYKFDNWTSSNGTFGTATDMSTTFTPDANNAVATANYSLINYTITYAENSDIASYADPKPVTGNYNSPIMVTATATANHVITGASTNVAGVTPTCTSGLNTQTATFTFTMPASDIELTLVTALGEVNLNFGSDANGTLSAKIGEDTQTTGTQISGGSVVNFTANPNTGYEVEGWYSDSEFKNKIDDSKAETRQVTANADVNVYVQFQEKKFNVTLVAGVGTKDLIGGGSSIGQITGCAITASVNDGYTWDKWVVTNGAGTFCENNPATQSNCFKPIQNSTLTATATETPYTITLVSADENKGTVNGPTVTAKVVTTTTITATPKSGYIFDYWEASNANIHIANSKSASTTITATETGTVTAHFIERFALQGSQNNHTEQVDGMPGDDATNLRFSQIDGNNLTLAVNLVNNKNYHFRIVDMGTNPGTRIGAANESNSMNWHNNSNWNLSGTNWIYLNPTATGAYTIHYNFSTKSCSVDFPQVTCLVGTFNSYSSTDNVFNFNGNIGTTSVTLAQNTTYDLKLIVDGKWYRDEGGATMTEDHCTNWLLKSNNNGDIFHLLSSAAGTYTFTFDKSTDRLSVTYPSETKVPVTVYLDGFTPTIVNIGSNPVAITAQVPEGMNFNGWVTTGDATVANENDATTTVTNAGTNGTVKATFNTNQYIYFKDGVNGKFGNVWVNFRTSDYWDDNNGSGNKDLAYGNLGMTKISNTDIHYFHIDDTHKNWEEVTNGIVQFTNTGEIHQNFSMMKVAYPHHNNSNSCYRACLPLFVPRDWIYDINRSQYYNDGIWMKYNSIESGYRIKGSWDSWTSDDYRFVAETPGGYEFKTTIHLAAGTTYSFKLWDDDNRTYSVNGVMKSTSCTNWQLYMIQPFEDQPNCQITTTDAGDYTFTLNLGSGEVIISVQYPLSASDYQVVAKQGETVKWVGDLIKHSNEAKKDTTSFFNNNYTYQLQQYAGEDTWNDVDGQMVTITDDKAKVGVINLIVTQDGNGNASLAYEGIYTGNYYIRTDGVDGGWGDYKNNSDNKMDNYGSLIVADPGYQYDVYKAKWILSGKNVKFRVANDYSKAISGEFTTDAIINDKETLPEGANVRFMWNSQTNQLKRAYLSGSTNTQDRYLVLEGDNKMFDHAGNVIPVGTADNHREGLLENELPFADNNNWVYQVDIQAQPGCEVKLTAKYNNQIQYFIGAAGEESGSRRKIIDGSGTNKYSLRAVYDFKTNRLVAGWIPSGTIDDNIVLGSDMLIERIEHGDASQIVFGGASAASLSISEIQHIYGVLKLKKETMLNATETDYAKCIYWISFPFDVKVSEIFGVEKYGEVWAISKYNGEKRAEKGWFKQDTQTFWEFLSPSDVMKANVGYTLNLDPDYFNKDSSEPWKNSATEVSWYFPSIKEKVGIVSLAQKDTTLESMHCTIDRTFDPGDGRMLNHKFTDSNWRVIGVPAFQDLQAPNFNPAPSDEGIFGLKGFYEWVSSTNTYEARTTDGYTFKATGAYMVQYEGKITWSNAAVITTNKAPWHAPEYTYADAKNYSITLEFGDETYTDQTFVTLIEKASNDFVLNEDMMKIDNAGFPNIYSFAGAYDVAYNETTFDNQTVMLGVSAPKDGSYTFAMPKDFSGKAILVDLESGEATDLNLSDYTVELNKGTYNNRFQLLLEVEAQSPTNMNPTKGEWSVDGKTKKLFINDNIYLINAGRIYNVLGVGE